MEFSFSIENLPPEDSDSIIPILSNVRETDACSLWEAPLESVQMASDRYIPTTPVVPTAKAAPANSSALVASHAETAPASDDIYGSTLTTPVIAAKTTFQYPPTPSERGSFEGIDQLQLQQSDVHTLQPVSWRILEEELTAGVVYDQPLNPFPSLPTPPDMEVKHQIYSSPHGNSSMSLSGELTLSDLEGILKVPAIPAPVKDGKQVIISHYLINTIFQVIIFIIYVCIDACAFLHRIEDISCSRGCLLPECWTHEW